MPNQSDRDRPSRRGFFAWLLAGKIFFLSILVHVLFIVGATIWVIQIITNKPKPRFKEGPPRGNQAARAVEYKVSLEKKSSAISAPINAKRVTTSGLSQVALPAMPEMPSMDTISPVKMGEAFQPVALGMQGGSISGIGARSSSLRFTALAKWGGKPASDLAVLAALRWLQKVQNPDGSWGSSDKWPGAMTGFALLCFLGHGETPAGSKEFGATVNKAITALVNSGTKYEGALTLRGAKELDQQPDAYAHGIATYALGEAYTMTKDARIAPVLTQAVNIILKGQADDGGWMYSYTRAMPSDTSVSGWQIQALKAAIMTKLPIDGLPAAMDNAMKNLDRVYDPKTKTFGYRMPGDRNTLNGVGVLCKVAYEERVDQKARGGVDYILTNLVIKYDGDTANLYSWYYNTQACFMVGGNAWQKWNRLFQDELIHHQSPDGSWPPNVAQDVGGLPKDTTIDGQLYRTCLCTLMLEVYYRYLPSSQTNEKEQKSALDILQSTE